MSSFYKSDPVTFDESSNDSISNSYDLFETVTPYNEGRSNDYQKAKEELKELKIKEEEIRKKAYDLEELAKKENILNKTRNSIIKKINHNLNVLSKGELQSRKLHDECKEACESLENYLDKIKSITSITYGKDERKFKIDEDLKTIQEAEQEISRFNTCLKKIQGSNHIGGYNIPFLSYFNDNEEIGGFLNWMKNGLAFSIPIGIIMFIVLYIF